MNSMNSMSSPSKRKREMGKHNRVLATTACETCRARKTKCDEDHPRCGFCERLNLQCIYRKVIPTKKDNTLAQILEAISSIHRKIDLVLPIESIGATSSATDPEIDRSVMQREFQPSTASLSTPGTSRRSVNSEHEKADAETNPYIKSPDVEGSEHSDQSVPARAHSLAWPAIQALFQCESINLSQWDGETRSAEKWLVDISEDFGTSLPVGDHTNIRYSDNAALSLQPGQPMTLNRGYVENVCSVYFKTFHCTYPILDRSHFFSTILPQVCSQSFDEANPGSTLVLMVLALGVLAQEGAFGEPISDETGWQSGVRGGSVERPPGLNFLNAAKIGLGIALSEWSMDSLSSYILCAIYYSQCSRNLEFYRVTTLACTICKTLVKSQYDTFENDRISRCYWMCVILESGLTGELGMDSTGILALQDSVPLPRFLSEPGDHVIKTDDDLFIEYHFLAQVSLRTLIDRIRASLPTVGNVFRKLHQQPAKALAQELSQQLTYWRRYLPAAIAWDDDYVVDPMEDIYMTNSREGGAAPSMVNYRSILSATLRTRYRYAEYLLWRPYIYGALEVPTEITPHDVDCCYKAYKACIIWPLTTTSFQSQRRLVPHLYEYTHTFFGILVLLYISSFSAALRQILESSQLSKEIEATKTSYLGWIRDMRVVHPVANWCWHKLRNMYDEHSLMHN